MSSARGQRRRCCALLSAGVHSSSVRFNGPGARPKGRCASRFPHPRRSPGTSPACRVRVRCFSTAAPLSNASAALPPPSWLPRSWLPPRRADAAGQSQPTPPAAPAAARFGYDDVVRRARELSARPLRRRLRAASRAARQARLRLLPRHPLPERQGAAGERGRRVPDADVPSGVPVQQPRHRERDSRRHPAPVPYSATLFDYGRNKFERPLPVNLGFAGFRLHYPLNDPKVNDELISFLGASYFRFLGRKQRYGLSARGLAIGVGAKETEEFPIFKEFWIEQPQARIGARRHLCPARRGVPHRGVPVPRLSRRSRRSST